MQNVGLVLISTFLALVVKENKPLFSFMLRVFVGVLIFIFIIDVIAKIVKML
ncbi:SpoIIIAC/SpoIIIAD family protein [Halalkalibacter flavus]|uniref:SpoIIIAC/SpoIIIAD family protein n=1 Tax=Halalkalibacter flavus TaxID=3090668 RepID=UPI002FC8A7B1